MARTEISGSFSGTNWRPSASRPMTRITSWWARPRRSEGLAAGAVRRESLGKVVSGSPHDGILDAAHENIDEPAERRVAQRFSVAHFLVIKLEIVVGPRGLKSVMIRMVRLDQH